MKNRIAVLGDGGWGTTLAILLAKKGFLVSLWGAFPHYISDLKRTRINKNFLPGVRIPSSVHITNSLDIVVDSNIIILAVPSPYLRSVLNKIRKPGLILKDKFFLSVIKGIENHTLMRMSEVIQDCLGRVKLVVLSGPTIAHEVARRIPTTAVAASKSHWDACSLQEILMTDRFRIYTHSDVVGVELGGSLKNIIAIACGISDGLGFGTNTKAAILSRGLAEMVRLGKKMGANEKTFSGISGVGDLVTTCISPYSRNRFVGLEIAKGGSLKEILEKMHMVAEGIYTVKSAYQLSKKYGVDMPITKEIYNVLYKNKSPLKVVSDLMTREKKRE